MQLVKPWVKLEWITAEPLKTIEHAGRTCYRSEAMITSISAEAFVKRLLERGHEAMIGHASASYRVICDRGVTHEIVRHRLFSYAQESTRYCNYKGGVTFIVPCWMDLPEGTVTLATLEDPMTIDQAWLLHLDNAENLYCNLLEKGWTPQQARSVLPNALKTEIVITGNLREWLHFFRLRTAKTAYPQMQEVANMLLQDIRERVPVIFEGILEK